MDDTVARAPALLAGRYELGRLLGDGGMGSVRDATDLRLRRPVAVKMLRADLAAQPEARRRFDTEAHAAARLGHPNVVTVFDCGEEAGIPFLVMERLPGRTLADELADGPLSLDRFHRVAREVLAALIAAHGAGIIHRDIKPGNVLLTDDGHVKVGDFGIAKAIDTVDQTQTVELIATPAYLAPERLNGEPATPRSDLYSVGVLLYEVLAGRRPFVGDTPAAVMRSIERGEAPPLAGLRPGLPARLVAIVDRAMARDPDRRFGSAAEMAKALEPRPEMDETVPIVGVAVDGPETVPIDSRRHDGATEVLHLPSRESAEHAGAVARPRRRGAGLVAGVLVAGVLVAGFVANRHHNAPPAAGLSPTTATTPTTARPASTPLPSSLEDAIRKLEQAVAK